MSEMQNHTVHFSFDTTTEQAAIIQQKNEKRRRQKQIRILSRDGVEWLSFAA